MVNGFANDLFFECACDKCDKKLDVLIDASGKNGEIPDLLLSLKQRAQKVYFVGYHRPREMRTPIRHCGNEVDLVEDRIQLFTKENDDIEFVSFAHVFPAGDTSYYALDRVHPSAKGSQVIAEKLFTVLSDDR